MPLWIVANDLGAYGRALRLLQPAPLLRRGLLRARRIDTHRTALRPGARIIRARSGLFALADCVEPEQTIDGIPFGTATAMIRPGVKMDRPAPEVELAVS
jgi:hypothetical protein